MTYKNVKRNLAIGDLVEFSDHTFSLLSGTFSHNSNKYILTGSVDKTCRLYDYSNVNNPQHMHTFYENFDSITCTGFSPDETKLIVASNNGYIFTFDINLYIPLGTYFGHGGRVSTAYFSPIDGSKILSAGHDMHVIVWNALTQQKLSTLLGHTNRVNSAVFSKDEQTIISASDDGNIKVWNGQTYSFIKDINVHGGLQVNTAFFSSDDSLIISTGWDRFIQITYINNSTVKYPMGGHMGTVTYAKFNYNDKLVVSSSQDGTVKLWDSTIGIIIRTYLHPLSGVAFADFSYDGAYIITGGADNFIRIWTIGCNFGQYLDPADSVCKPCLFKCAKCENNYECIECKIGLYRSPDPPGCSCLETYYESAANDVNCFKCLSPCKTCSSPVICGSCLDSFYYDGEHRRCFDCVLPCINCSSQTQCESCVEGDIFRAGIEQNCQCKTNYTDFENKCVPKILKDTVPRETPKIESSKLSPLWIGVIGTVAGILFIIIIILLVKVYKKRKKRQEQLKFQQMQDMLKQQERTNMKLNTFLEDNKKNTIMQFSTSYKSLMEDSPSKPGSASSRRKQKMLSTGQSQKNISVTIVKNSSFKPVLTEKQLSVKPSMKNMNQDNLIHQQYVNTNIDEDP